MSLPDLDRCALLVARTRFHGRAAEQVIGSFSRTGEHAAIWFVFGAAGAIGDPPRRRAWVRGVEAVAAAYALNYAVKLTVRRRRPELPGLPPLTPTVSRLSFPSAHATSSFAAAGSFRAVAPAWPLYAMATAFAASRPYLGVHYPSDVVAGAALGAVVAAAWPRVEAVVGARMESVLGARMESLLGPRAEPVMGARARRDTSRPTARLAVRRARAGR